MVCSFERVVNSLRNTRKSSTMRIYSIEFVSESFRIRHLTPTELWSCLTYVPPFPRALRVRRN